LKIAFYILLTGLFLACGESSQRAGALQVKEDELNKKEQELLIKENSLLAREQELAKKEKLFDSTSRRPVNDTLTARVPALEGLWTVQMNCIETTCSGSAIGDTKTEQWEISLQNNRVTAKAESNNKLVRLYSGNYSGDVLELTAIQDSSQEAQSTKMIVRLQHPKDNKMEGERQILRGEDCRIVYNLQLRKL